MNDKPCRWYELVGGIACTRGGPNRGCRSITVNSCSYPGFEQLPLDAGIGHALSPNCRAHSFVPSFRVINALKTSR